MDTQALRSLMTTAQDIRHWFAQVHGQTTRTDRPNPYYSVSDEGHLLLEARQGSPCMIWTPCGGLSILNQHRASNWLLLAWERLALVPVYFNNLTKDEPSPANVQPVYETGMCGGLFGPVYAITKALDGSPLPKADRIHATNLGSRSGFYSDIWYGRFNEAKTLWDEVRPDECSGWSDRLAS